MTTQYVVYQSRTKYSRDPIPVGAFDIRQLEKITAKCIFLKSSYWTVRLKKEEIFYRVFDSKDAAIAFVGEHTATAQVGLRAAEMQDAKEVYEAAVKAHKAAQTQAGEAAWADEIAEAGA